MAAFRTTRSCRYIRKRHQVYVSFTPRFFSLYGQIQAHRRRIPREGAFNSSDFKGDIETAEEPSTEEFAVLENERDIATHVVTVVDDETLNPWTFRC
jgi:hypothetical protein